ncbi:hypothetical protein C8R47DRAFT_1080691 [Mycena vitilis]|nr:hypothetical protein C8R47DRAFT_1080691 [Mycena vitilis]
MRRRPYRPLQENASPVRRYLVNSLSELVLVVRPAKGFIQQHEPSSFRIIGPTPGSLQSQERPTDRTSSKLQEPPGLTRATGGVVSVSAIPSVKLGRTLALNHYLRRSTSCCVQDRGATPYRNFTAAPSLNIFQLRIITCFDFSIQDINAGKDVGNLAIDQSGIRRLRVLARYDGDASPYGSSISCSQMALEEDNPPQVMNMERVISDPRARHAPKTDEDLLDGEKEVRSKLRARSHNEDESDAVDTSDSATTRTLRPRPSLTSGLPPRLRARRCEQDEGVAWKGSNPRVTAVLRDILRDETDALRGRDEEDRAPEPLPPSITRAGGPTAIECDQSTVNGENFADSQHLDEVLPRRTRGRPRKHPTVSTSEGVIPEKSSSDMRGAQGTTTVDGEEHCASTSERNGSAITLRRRRRAKEHSVVPRRRGRPRKQLLEAAVEDQSRRRGSYREQLFDATLDDPPRIGRLSKQLAGDARALSEGDAGQALPHGVESRDNTAPTSAEGTLTGSGEIKELVDGGEGSEADVLLPPQNDNQSTAATCGWNDNYCSLILNSVLPPLVSLNDGTTPHGPSDSLAPGPSSLTPVGIGTPSLPRFHHSVPICNHTPVRRCRIPARLAQGHTRATPIAVLIGKVVIWTLSKVERALARMAELGFPRVDTVQGRGGGVFVRSVDVVRFRLATRDDVFRVNYYIISLNYWSFLSKPPRQVLVLALSY